MNPEICHFTARPDRGFYHRLPLPELLRRIVEEADREALLQFHDERTLFSYLEESRLRFAEYLGFLRKSVEATLGGDFAFQAYDLTTDKFLRLPKAGEPGVDCRNYFRAALTIFASQSPADEIRAELVLAEIVQRLVYRHFALSLKEGQRTSEMTRYLLTLPGGSLLLLLPRSLSGPERRKWLLEHVPDVDPCRLGERERVQMIIHQAFDDCTVPFDDGVLTETLLHPSDYPGFFANSLSVAGLAATVAEEKSARLLEQRPAIQALGAASLKTLIMRIFEDIAAGDYQEGEIARQFGLSKATFSRFAGGQWNSHLPDLFRNAAQVLSRSPAVMEILRDLHVRPRNAVMPRELEGLFL